MCFTTPSQETEPTQFLGKVSNRTDRPTDTDATEHITILYLQVTKTCCSRLHKQTTYLCC